MKFQAMLSVASCLKRIFHSCAQKAMWALAVFALSGLHVFSEVQLQTRTVTPSKDSTAEFVRILKASPAREQHGLASFSRHPTPEERKALSSAGIRVLSPFSETNYLVRVEKRVDLRALEKIKLTTYLFRLDAEDRVEPRIWRGDFARYIVKPLDSKPLNFVLNADDTLNLTVRFHIGIPEAQLKNVVQKYARSFEKQSDETWILVVPRGALRALATEDLVRWIDAGPPPFLPDNNTTRATINVDPVQNFNAAAGQVQGLGGNGIQVGIFDSGVDQTHNDFGTRVVLNAAGMAGHGTHVAGIVAGNGTLSNGVDSWGLNNNGAAFQWRGMAPLAQLIDSPGAATGANAATHLGYITNQGMDISNHSYSFSFDGVYDNSNQTRDQIIRGDAVSGTTQVPARLHVYSAGNHGNFPNNGGNQVGYFSLTKQVKNGLVVGNWNVGANQIWPGSSLGPAHDGRIKPDVVAPGSNVRSAGFCANGENVPAFCQNAAGQLVQRQDFYRVMGGTSMASPVVTGSLALVLQQYATTYAVNVDQSPPLPSTLRGVMIHTATDIQAPAAWFNNPDGAVQPTPGPDFVTGWGMINAQAAVNVVANRLLLENTVTNTCDGITYTFQLPPGTVGNIRVTLAWDDVAGNPALANTARKLVNDLDLILVDPNGQRHYPWQLDQRIVDTFLNPVPDDQQLCGTAYAVQRQFRPVANPVFVAAGDPNNVNDVIPVGGVPQAVRGRDRLNNVEVVDAPAIAGTWEAQVIGFNIPQGPQRFSLIGYSFSPFGLVLDPDIRCRFNLWLCGKIPPANFCQRYPKLCEKKITFPKKGQIRFDFMDSREKVMFPLSKICQYVINCPGCGPHALCASYDLQISNMSTPLRVEIYSSQGKLVKRDISDSLTKRLQFDARPDEEYLLAFSPGKGTKLNMNQEVSLHAR